MASVCTASLRALGPRVQSRMIRTMSKNLVVCQAERQAQGGAPPPPARPAVPRPPPGVRPPPQFDHPMFEADIEVVPVQRLDDDLYSGVVAMDRGEAPSDLSRILLLAGGDAAALVAFATIGRLSHGESLSLLGSFATAAPFLVGWYGAAVGLGAFGKEAQGSDVSKAAWAAAHAWAVGIPVGLLLRSVFKGYVPDTSFLLVSMAATGVFLIGWRAALAAATPEAKPKSVREELTSRRDRRGGIFEFLDMIVSMTRRW